MTSLRIKDVPPQPTPLAVGQMWFVVVDLNSGAVDLYKIVGVWSKVVALQRQAKYEPRYHLGADIRFVEQVTP